MQTRTHQLIEAVMIVEKGVAKCKYKKMKNNADVTLDPFFCTHRLLSTMNMFFADISTKGKSHTHK